MARKPTKAGSSRGRRRLGPLADVVLPPEDAMTASDGMPSDRGIVLPDISQPLPDPMAVPSDAMPVDVMLGDDASLTDPMAGEPTQTMLPDGSLEIDFNPLPAVETLPFDGNLATVLDDGILSSIAMELLEGIEADDQSRAEWLQDRADGIKLLGLKLEDPRSSNSSAPVEGMSVVRHPLLLDAVTRFQANARGELLPAQGPVKVVNDGMETVDTDKQAGVLQDMFNHYLTSVATEYYPDTNRMLFEVGFSGVAFKKVYTCPLRRRPVSETIFGKDLIVSNAATDLENAGRVTHRIDMRPSVLKRMQIAGQYRDVPVGVPQQQPDVVSQAVANAQGIQPTTQRPEDQDYEILECYCELDIAHPDFQHKDEAGEPTGLPLPYRVTIEKHSKQILDIRRNWKENDPDYKRHLNIVKFPFVDGLDFYSIGLLQMLGNTTAAATAAIRMMLDAGMFANFPGGLIAEQAGRQINNNFRPGPGEFAPVKTNGMRIQDAIMPMPYKGIDGSLMELTNAIVQTGQRLAATQETPVGEGKQDAPVGTTLALIEGQQKVMSAVHRNLHTAQKREFELLVEEFKKDPEALWRNNKRAIKYFDVQSCLQALENFSLVPHSDPNVPSQMHRMAKMQALYQVASAAPMLFNLMEVAREMLQEIGFSDPDRFFAPPAPPQPDPMQQMLQLEAQTKMAQTQIKGQELQLKAQKQQFDMATAADKMETERAKAVLDLATTLARYPQSDAVVDQQLIQMAPFLNSPMGLAQARSLQMPRRAPRRRPAMNGQLGLGFA